MPKQSTGKNTLNTEDFNMKLLKSILSFVQSMREANYAANLARNGKVKESQACYK